MSSSSINMVGHDEESISMSPEVRRDTSDELTREDEEHPVDIIKIYSVDPTGFLNALIDYRSKYLIYPFESQVAIEDFIKNWIPIPKQKFERLIDEFQSVYLDDIQDSDSHILDRKQQKVRELVKKIWVTDGMGIPDDECSHERFLERLKSNVKDQITPPVRLPVDDFPPIDDFIKDWLKVEIPISELEKAILELKGKYVGNGSEVVRINDLKEEDRVIIHLFEQIWAFGTQTDNDEDGTENSTEE